MLRRFIFFYCLLLIAAAVRLFGQQAETESKLVILERMWNEAQVSRDDKALRELVSDGFVNTEYDGEVSDKTKFLADIHDPEYRPTSMTIDDVRARLFRDTAIVTGNYHVKGSYQGKPYDHQGRFTDTWFFENGHWQCIASHSSLVKK